MAEFKRAARVGDVLAGKGKLVELEGRQIALFYVGGVYYALDNACSHRGGPLSQGNSRQSIVTCPWHGAQFDVTNGQVVGPPASSSVTAYPTKVEGDEVWVEIP